MRLPSEVTLDLPGSKSHANRAIVCAALATGKTVIRGATPCDDVSVMVENLQKMGFRLRWKDTTRGELEIDGGLPSKEGNATLDCHNAGTTLRFLTSVAALLPGAWVVTGDDHMKRRLIGDLTKALRSLGSTIQDSGGCPPLQISGGMLTRSEVTLKADISSQYLTSLLLIAPQLPGGLTIHLAGDLASSGYIDLTLKVMRDFGIKVDQKSNTFIVQHQQYRPISQYQIEGDWSAAGAWTILSRLTQSVVNMPTLKEDSEQSDRLLSRAVQKLASPGSVTLNCEHIPDQVMNLCVFAATRKGVATLTGIRNLRTKECDRLAVVASELRKAGVKIKEDGDDLIIRGAGSLARLVADPFAVTLDPHDDHRMAMCFALLGLLRGGITIRNPACVAKSYPHFFEDLRSVLQHHRPVTIVGMRGVGKSSLGRRLATVMKSVHEDSDQLFEKKYGPIRLWIEKHGWADFRSKEEAIIVDALRSGIVLSLGGGALGAAGTRKAVKTRSVPVWLQASERELLKRLGNAKRPRLTDLPLHEEIRKFLIERGPQYREVARIEVSPRVRFREQAPFVLTQMRNRLLGIHQQRH